MDAQTKVWTPKQRGKYNRKQTDAILSEYGKYQQLFLDYLEKAREMKKQQQKALAIVVAAAQEAMDHMQAIRADQKAQLVARMENSQARFNDKLTKADDANRIIKWYLEIRQYEKQFFT